GIRVLVDLDLLNGRGRNHQIVHFDAVHEEGRAVGPDRTGIEKARHGREDVLVEDRQVFDRARIDARRVEIRCRIRLDLRGRVADGDLLTDRCQRERHPYRNWRQAADVETYGRWLKAFERDEELVSARQNAV